MLKGALVLGTPWNWFSAKWLWGHFLDFTEMTLIWALRV